MELEKSDLKERLDIIDSETILKSIRKNGRVVIVSEDVMACGVGAELSAVIAENAIDSLDAPIKRIGIPNTPVPFAPNNEKIVIPQEEHIVQAVKDLLT